MTSIFHKFGSLISLFSLFINLLPPLTLPVYAGEDMAPPARSESAYPGSEVRVPFKEPTPFKEPFFSIPAMPAFAPNSSPPSKVAASPGVNPWAASTVDPLQPTGIANLSLSKPAFLAALPEPAPTLHNRVLPAWFETAPAANNVKHSEALAVLPPWFVSTAENEPAASTSNKDRSAITVLPNWFDAAAQTAVPAAPESPSAAGEILPAAGNILPAAGNILPAWFNDNAGTLALPPAAPQQRPLANPIPQVQVTVDAPDNVSAGNFFGDTYTITVRNPSGNTGLNFYLEARIPISGFNYVPGSAVWVSSLTGPITYTDSYADPQVIWTPNVTRTLAPGEVVTLTFRMTTDGAAISGQRLEGRAHYNFGTPPSSGTSFAGVNVTVGRGNLVISKSPTLQDGTYGDVVNWDIEVANTGLGMVYSATVFDVFGSGYTNTNAAELAVPPFHLDIGQRRSFVVTATINACTNLTNTGLAYWSIGNDEGNGIPAKPVSDTTDIAYLLKLPQVSLAANTIAFDYCTPAPQTVVVTATNSAGPALNFALASNLNSQPFTFTAPAGWVYNPGTGVFSYTANGGVLTHTNVTLSFVVTPTFNVCSAAGNGSFNFTPRYQDACGLDFNGPPLGLNYTYGAGQQPSFDLSKTARDSQIFAGDTTEFYVDFNIQNVQNISGNIIITDIVPSALALTSVTAGGLGTIAQNGNEVVWTVPAAGSGAFSGRLTLTVQAQDVLTNCGTNSIATNRTSGQAPVNCPGCPPLTDSDSANVYIQNIVGQASVGISTDGQVCGLINFTNHYSVPVTSWAGVVFTETMGHNDGVPGDDVPPGTLTYLPDSLTIFIDGVDRTAEITITHTTPQLVLDFSGVTAPTGTRGITISYALAIADDVLAGNPDIAFFNWSILTVPGAGDSGQCQGGDTFYQGLPIELQRADLQINISPQSFDSCATVPVVLTVSDPDLVADGLVANNIVVTFTVPSPDFDSITGYTYGGGFFDNPVTVTTGTNLITWTFQNPLTQTGTTTGTINFNMTRSCTAPALRAGVSFADRCAITYGDTDTDPGLTVPPNVVLFVTPDQFTVNENQATWRIYATNNGAGPAGRTLITNTLSSGLQFVSYTTNLTGQVSLLTPGPFNAGDDVVWQVLNLTPGQQIRIDVDTVKVVACDPLTTSVTLDSGCLGYTCQAPQTDSLNFLVPPFAVRTSNAQTADLPFCDIGEAILNVKNSSATAHVYGLIISQTITALDYISGSSFVTVTDRYGNIVDGLANIPFEPVTQTVDGGTLLMWRLTNPGITLLQTQVLTNRAPEDTIRIRFQVQTDCSTSGSNTVRSQAAGYHSCGSFFTSQENSDTIPKEQPQISLSKVGRNITAGDINFSETVFGEPGDEVVWQITANNGIGAYRARNVVIVDTLPPNMDDGTPTAVSNPVTGVITISSGAVVWDIGDLPADGTDRTLWITTTIDDETTACATSNINTATLTYGCDFSGGYCPGEPFVATATLRTQPNITAQTLSTAPLNTCGGPITVTLTNNGPPAYNIYLTNTIPAGYVYSDTAYASTAPSSQPAYGNTTAVWAWTGGITLPTGVTTLTFRVVNSATTGICTNWTAPSNRVEVSYDDHSVCEVTDPQTTTATSNLTVNSPNLQISKTPAFQVAGVGETITWTITVNNVGSNSGDAFGVVVTDSAGSQYQNLTPISNTTSVPANFIGSNQITWVIGTLPAGGSWHAILTAVLTETGTNLNQADVSAECATGCTSNVITSTTAYVSLLNDFNKSPNIQTGTIGSLVTFDLRATLSDHDGDYHNIMLTDTLPAGLGFVSVALTYTANAESGGTPTLAPAPTTPGQYNPGPIVWNLGDQLGVVEIEGTITAVVLDNAVNYNGARRTNNARLTYTQDGSPYSFNDTGDVDILEPVLHIGKSYVTPDGCGATLLAEDFNDNVADGVSITGTWSVQSGVYANTNSTADSWRAFFGQTGWTDYSYSFMVRPALNQGEVGAYFRQSTGGSNDNGYHLRWTTTQLRLDSRTPNINNIVPAVNFGFTAGRWYHVEIRAVGTLLQVYVDGILRLQAPNDIRHSQGRVGLYVNNNQNTGFDDILVTKLGRSGCTVGANDLVTYTLTISSQSILPGYDLVITDAIPAGMSLVTYTMTSNDATNPAITGQPAPIPGATGTLIWTVDHLTATTTPINHAALTLTVVLQVADSITANTILANQAFLSYDNWPDATQPIPTIVRTSSGGSHATAVRTVDGGIRKNILPIEPPPTATLGTLVTYTLIVPAEPITATLYNVVVTDTLSQPRFYIENVTASGGTGALSSFSQSAGQITATFASIPHGQQGFITITTRISHEFPSAALDPNRGDVITNAAVMTHATATQITRTNEVSTTVYEPRLTISKVGAVVAGNPQAVDYTVRITNIGNAIAYGPLVIHDLIPPGVTVSNISGGGQLLPDNRTISWTVDSLAINASLDLTYTLHLTGAIYTSNLFTNTAIVTNTSLTNTIPGVRPYVTDTVYTFPWPLGRIGNYVWVDNNYDGIQTGGETPLPGVVVDLYDSTTGDYITSTSTSPTGEYYFENLPLNVTYTVQLSTVNFTGVLSPYVPTRLNAGSNTADDSDANPDATFNGFGYAITTTLTLNPVFTQDLTLDYGFVPLMALGNRVWFDADDDGFRDGTEPVIPDVLVYLYRDANGNGQPDAGELISTTLTNNGGFYTFTNLLPSFYPTETYYVVITSSNFAPGGPLAGYRPSTPVIPADKLAGSDDWNHGATTGPLGSGGYVASTVITLTPYAEPFGYLTPGDGNANYTIDFGFLRTDLGDLPNDGSSPVGYAPQTYPTQLADNGASHAILPGNNPTLGSRVDAEPDGQPALNADGDDLNGGVSYHPATGSGDDEDGITFSGPLVPGEVLTITITTLPASDGGADGRLTAWIDFDGDGVLEDGERIATDLLIPAGSTIVLTLTVPLTTQQGITTYSRFRLGSATESITQPTGHASAGEVEDYAIPTVMLDWGDLPPGYNTLYAQNGPRHVIISDLQMGPNIDAETNGIPSPGADGDDANHTSDDEDGVTFPPEFIPGSLATFTVSVTNTTGITAYVYGFIDWNADGDFNGPNETIVVPTTGSGNVNLTYTVPATAAIDTTFGLRFRLSTDATLGPDGFAPDGEIEDYVNQIPRYDWGDLPDGIADLPDYNTLYGNNGPRHLITSSLQLGPVIDAENNGFPSANANGDDNDNLNDEDSVTFPAQTELIPGTTVTYTVAVINNTGTPAVVYGFIDWNADGDFDDLNEIVTGTIGSIGSGTVDLTYTIPLTAAIDTAFGLRFRLSTDSTLGPDGFAPDGEVEDYITRIPRYDWGDLPDSTIPTLPDYHTTINDNGPRHLITDALQMGPNIDAETNGFPSANADGDDLNQTPDDEDGVTFPPVLVRGNTVTFTVAVTNQTGTTAYVYGFIDWNADGDFDGTSEVVSGTIDISGNVNLVYTIPADAPVDTPFGLRFRLSTDAALGPDGFAPDGEVEDYIARIPPPTLNFVKRVTPASGVAVQPGDLLTYTLCYSNSGGAIATNVVITDFIPANTTYVSNSVTVDTGSVEFYDGTDWVSSEPGTVTGLRWLVGDVQPNGISYCVGFNVTINMTLSDTVSGLSVMRGSEGWIVLAGDTTGLEILGYTGVPTATQPAPTPVITAVITATPVLTTTPEFIPTLTPTIEPATVTPTSQPAITFTITGSPVEPTATATMTPVPDLAATATTIPAETSTPTPPAPTETVTGTIGGEPTSEPETVAPTSEPAPTPEPTTPADTENTGARVGAPPVIHVSLAGSAASLVQPAIVRAQISPTETTVSDTPPPLPTLTPTIEPTLTLEPTATQVISPTAPIVISTVEATATAAVVPTATETVETTATPTFEPTATPTLAVTPEITDTFTPEVITTPQVITTPEVVVTPAITETVPVTDTPAAQSYAIVALDTVVIDIVNQATIGSDQTPTQTAAITRPVARVVDPAIAKSVDPTQARPGETVRFYITIDNPSPPNSNANATNVVVVDPLPLTVDLVNYTVSSMPAGIAHNTTVTTRTVATGHPTITQTVASTITVSIPVLAPGEHVFLTIETVVNNLASPPPQTINNNAYLSFNEGAPRADSSPPILVPTPPRPGGGGHNNDDDDDDDDDAVDNTPPPAPLPPPTPEVQPTMPILYLPETGSLAAAEPAAPGTNLLLLSLFSLGLVAWLWRRRNK